MDGKKIDQLWHEAPEDREPPPPRPGGAGGSSAGSGHIEQQTQCDHWEELTVGLRTSRDV